MTATGSSMAALDVDTRAPLDFDFRCYFLHRPRVQLYRRIDRRCEQMAVGGLFEVRAHVCLVLLMLHLLMQAGARGGERRASCRT